MPQPGDRRELAELEERVHLGRGQVFPAAVSRIGEAGGCRARHLQNIVWGRVLRVQFLQLFFLWEYTWILGAVSDTGCFFAFCWVAKTGLTGMGRPGGLVSGGVGSR